MTTVFVLICRICNDGYDPEDILALPFPDARKRGKWAADHTAATGHDLWTVFDHELVTVSALED